MPSELSLAHARRLKAAASSAAAAAPSPLPRSQWFVTGTRVGCDDFFAHADAEVAAFFDAGPHVTHECDAAAQLDAWIAATDEQELALVLDGTPSGCAASDDGRFPAIAFTPTQRLSMALYLKLPFRVTARVAVPPSSYAGGGRAEPIGAHACLLEGSFPKTGLVPFSTGCGKTLYAWTIAFGALTDAHYPALVAEHRRSALHTVVHGLPELPVARLAIFSTSAATVHHAIHELQRLLPALRALAPALDVEVWTTVGKRTSVRQAAERPASTAVLWVVPETKLSAVLNADPDVAVAMHVADEIPPSEQRRGRRSSCLRRLALSATPQALAEPRRSWLHDALGGAVHRAADIAACVRWHRYTQAQRQCEQLCTLDLVAVASAFVVRIRTELRDMMPSVRTHAVRSRRVTLAAALDASHGDFVPASFANMLMAALRPLRPTAASVAAVRAHLESAEVSVSSLVRVLQTEVRTDVPHLEALGEQIVARLTGRLRDFAESCPICLSDAPHLGEANRVVSIFACCGYCTCALCHARCTQCPFCRTPVPSHVPREEALLPRAPDAAAGDDDFGAFATTADLASDLARVSEAATEQGASLTRTVRCLVAHGHARLLLFVEAPQHVGAMGRVHADLDRLASEAGVRVVKVDGMLTGKGVAFARHERAFDSADPQPMALVTFVNRYNRPPSKLLVGTNLVRADALVAVGEVPDHAFTQAMGRIFRPHPLRDPTREVPMVKLHAA
jgi:hypothetical protein